MDEQIYDILDHLNSYIRALHLSGLVVVPVEVMSKLDEAAQLMETFDLKHNLK